MTELGRAGGTTAWVIELNGCGRSGLTEVTVDGRL